MSRRSCPASRASGCAKATWRRRSPKAFEREPRRGPVGGHAHRGHRPDGRAGARRSPGRRGAGALPAAQVHARIARRDEAEALARMAPPVWVEDKYDGIRAQLHKRGARGPPVQPRPARRERAVPRGQRRRGRAAVGRHPRRRDARLARRQRAAVPAAPGEARRERNPRRRSRRRCRSSTSPSTCWRYGRMATRPVEPLLRLSLRERRARLDALGLATTTGFGVSNLDHRHGRGRAAEPSSSLPSSAATRA